MIMNKRGGGEFPFAALIENIHPSVAERGRRLKKKQTCLSFEVLSVADVSETDGS